MKYNSVCTIAFTIDHNEEDGSDITPQMIRSALAKRMTAIMKNDESEFLEACLPVDDTQEND